MYDFGITGPSGIPGTVGDRCERCIYWDPDHFNCWYPEVAAHIGSAPLCDIYKPTLINRRFIGSMRAGSPITLV